MNYLGRIKAKILLSTLLLMTSLTINGQVKTSSLINVKNLVGTYQGKICDRCSIANFAIKIDSLKSVLQFEIPNRKGKILNYYIRLNSLQSKLDSVLLINGNKLSLLELELEESVDSPIKGKTLLNLILSLTDENKIILQEIDVSFESNELGFFGQSPKIAYNSSVVMIGRVKK